jgi:hypothetical protein
MQQRRGVALAPRPSRGTLVDMRYRRRVVAGGLALALAVAGLAAVYLGQPSAGAANGGSVLRPGEILDPGQRLVSPNRWFTLRMQGDGNLVLEAGGTVLFATGTSGWPGARLQNQSDDGNIVLLAPGDRPLWDTETFGNPGTVLQLQDDGNLVAVAPNGRAVFSTNTIVNPGGPSANGKSRMLPGEVLKADQRLVSPNRRYTLVMQGDGNLVLYRDGSRALFDTRTEGRQGVRLQNQSDDGNIVLLAPREQVLWDTETFGNPGTVLQLQDDGNLVALAPPGDRVVFSTDTWVNPGGESG